MEQLDLNNSRNYVLHCIKWCVDNDETKALEEYLRLYKDKLKDELKPLLFESVSKRRMKVVKIILDSLDQEIRTMNDKDGQTWLTKLLFVAVETGDVDIVKSLLEKGANGRGSFQGKPILHIAASYGLSEIVTELVKEGGDICMTDRCGDGIIHSILSSQLTNKGPIVRRVIRLGADPLVKSSLGKLPVHLAAKNAPDVLVDLLRDGNDVNIVDDINEETPLHIACGAACRETILILLQYGTHFNLENKHGQTPLAKLLRFTNSHNDFHTKTRLNIAKVLISIGLRMSCQNNTGRDKFYDRYVSLKLSLKTPPRLQSLARTSIRGSLTLSSGLQKKINKLDIPINLKLYLMFQDLEL